MSEVDDINGNHVLFESHSQFFIVFHISDDGMSTEDDNPLLLEFVLSMLQRQLRHLDRSEDIGISVDLDIGDTVDKVADVIGLSKSQLNS